MSDLLPIYNSIAFMTSFLFTILNCCSILLSTLSIPYYRRQHWDSIQLVYFGYPLFFLIYSNFNRMQFFRVWISTDLLSFKSIVYFPLLTSEVIPSFSSRTLSLYFFSFFKSILTVFSSSFCKNSHLKYSVFFTCFFPSQLC